MSTAVALFCPRCHAELTPRDALRDYCPNCRRVAAGVSPAPTAAATPTQVLTDTAISHPLSSPSFARTLPRPRRHTRPKLPRHLPFFIGAGAIVLLALIVVISQTGGPSFSFSSSLNPRDFASTTRWIESNLNELNEISEEINWVTSHEAGMQLDVDLDRQHQYIGRELSSLLGQQITWQIPVAAVRSDYVYLQSGFSRTRLWCHFPDRTGPGNTNPPLDSYEYNPAVIGQSISLEQARSLRPGQHVTVVGTVANASFRGNEVVINLSGARITP